MIDIIGMNDIIKNEDMFFFFRNWKGKKFWGGNFFDLGKEKRR